MQSETDMLYAKTSGLKGIDIFGHPIGLIYKGNSSFQTRVGGLFTMILVLLILCKLITDISRMSISYTVVEYSDYDNNSASQAHPVVWTIDTNDVT